MTPWEQARPLLLPALEKASETSELELLQRLQSGHAQLWLGSASALVSQWYRDPHSLHVWLAGGNMDELLNMAAGIEAWARAHAALYVSIEGRPGWSRVLAEHGYRDEAGELRKAL